MEVFSDLVDWAQCELCKKWRKLPFGMNPNTLPEEWVCTMNTWDKLYSSCDAPEEVVGIPPENLHPSIPDQGNSYSDFHNRPLKGRKKNFSICLNSNSLTQTINSKQISNQSTSLIEDVKKDFNDNIIPDGLLSKSLIDSLSHWSEELKDNLTCLSSYNLSKSFPSCWPLEYQNLNNISLFRNKFFESFEKSKSKNNNFSGNYEILSNLKDSHDFPICIFKNNIINSKNHPLQGRSIITGTDVPIFFKVVGRSINGIFPIISKSQPIKYSNHQYTNNAVSLSNTQKSQSNVSNIHTNFLELIPATRSDWDSPFIDLSNSLFIPNSVNYKSRNHSDNWNKCYFSYSKLFLKEDNLSLTPSYLKESNFDLKAINSKIITDEFNEQTNIDVLDLFPIFSWLENPNNFNHHMYPKVSQSNLSIQTIKISKKCNINKSTTRNRTKQLDPDQTETTQKLRRSSRNASKVQSYGKSSAEDGIFSIKDDFTTIEANDSVLQSPDQFKNKELDSSTASSKLVDELNESIDKVDLTDAKLVVDLDERNDGNDLLEDNSTKDLTSKKNNKADQLESNNSSEIEKKELNQTVDNNEMDTLDRSIILNEIHFNNQAQSLSGDGEFPILDSEVESKKLFEDDEYILPALGSHKRKHRFSSEYGENYDSVRTEEINYELYESRNRTNKKRLRKKFISSEMNDKHIADTTSEICNSEFKLSSNETVPVTYPKADQEKLETNINSETFNRVNEKNFFHIIPRKKSFEVTTSISLSPKSDPWVPKSDTNANRYDNQLDDISQPHTQKMRNYNWQIDQKRQRQSDQRRTVQGSSSCHKNYYYQNKHRISTGYDSHSKHYPRHRSNSNLDFVNHHSTSFFNNSHYYSQNNLSGNQLIQLVPTNEFNYDYQSFKGYSNSKYSFSSSNSANSINRHYRGR
ncbi:CW-type Zinc Finger family [Cryptosporidium sp. chipmunk genotype I]|uniref:CW-type Zinc Finger family n=1 Tax=Cryptosporidium sp. chipmunk genotype I TaxID=1280935 RepID=UPI00351A69BA|nr:CW-type Zinc Finger family [Cryptosporidium sp. chipmunk genotype I]